MKNRVWWIGRWCCGLVLLATAPPAAAQQVTYYFPHLAVGASWQTTLTYINYSPQAVSCTTNFLSDSGAPALMPFGGAPSPTRTDNLAAGGSVHVETTADLSAPLIPGWAQATCTAPVKASLLFRRYSGTTPVAEAGVNATSTPATRFVTFAEQGVGKFGTGVAYANPSTTQSALVTFTVKDTSGQVLATVSKTLPPGGHDARNMNDPFFGFGLTSFTGSIEITSNVAIVTLALNFEADPVFSSLPPGELGAPAQGPFVYYFTHLALQGSWQTTLTYINVSAQTVTCNTSFIGNDGSPVLVPFGGAPATSGRTDSLPVGGSLHVESTADLNAPILGGWATATCTGEIKASLLFRRTLEGRAVAEAGVNASTSLTDRFVTFAEMREGAYGTGIALATGFQFYPHGCTVSAFNQAGQLLACATVLLFGPSATLHTAFNLGGPGGAFTVKFQQLGITNFLGSIHVTCNLPVVVSVALNFEADPVFSSLPPGELDSATPLATANCP